MSLVINIILIITALLALYWVFYGQRKYNEMLNPKRKTELKAILFDLDGVIIDSFEAWHSVINQVRKKYKLKEFSKEEYKRKGWAIPIEVEVARYFKGHDIDKITNECKALVAKKISKIKLLPDAKKVLQKIKEKNYKIGLVTNNYTALTSKILQHHKIKEFFNAIITTDDVEKPKPYPDPILKLCKKLNVMPDETIYVGDTKYDYKAGKSAGAFVVGLNTHGDLVISNLNDILQLL